MVVTPGEALVRVGESAAAAALEALRALGVEEAEQGEAHTVEGPGSAADGLEPPVVATTVSTDGGIRTILVLGAAAARSLAAAIAGEALPAGDDGAGEPDVAAVAPTADRIAAAAAGAACRLLGADGEPAAPETRVVEAAEAESFGAEVLVVSVALKICGAPAALVQLVPGDLAGRLVARLDPGVPDGDPHGAIAGDSLREVRVRLWAELGRTRMALGRAVGLAPGEVVELDAAVDDPVDIFVNGVRLGNGHLVVGDDGEWAFRVAEVSAGRVLDSGLAGNSRPGGETTTFDRKEP